VVSHNLLTDSDQGTNTHNQANRYLSLVLPNSPGCLLKSQCLIVVENTLYLLDDIEANTMQKTDDLLDKWIAPIVVEKSSADPAMSMHQTHKLMTE